MYYSERRKNLKIKLQDMYSAGAALRGETTGSIIAHLNEDGMRKSTPTIIIAPHFESKKHEGRNNDEPDVSFIYTPVQNSDLIQQIHVEEKHPWLIEVEFKDRTFYKIYRNYMHLEQKIKTQLERSGHPFSLDLFN